MRKFHVFQQLAPRSRKSKDGETWDANLLYVRDVSAYSENAAIREAKGWPEFRGSRGLGQFPIVREQS